MAPTKETNVSDDTPAVEDLGQLTAERLVQKTNSTSQASKEKGIKGTVEEIVEKKTDVVNHKESSQDDSDTVNQGGDECGEEVDIS